MEKDTAMLSDEEIEDLLFAIHYLLEGASLTPHGIKKYKYLEQTLLNIKRGLGNTPCPECGKLGGSHLWSCSLTN